MAKTVFLWILGIVVSMAIAVEGSEEQSSTKDRIQKLEQENQDLRAIVEELRHRLDLLEGKSAAKVESEKPVEEPKGKKKKKKEEKTEIPEPGTEEKTIEPEVKYGPMDEMVVDKQAKGSPKATSLLPSLKGEYFQLGGRLQVDYYNPGNETNLKSAIPENAGGSFKVDEMRLYLDADLKNQITFHGAFDIENQEEGTGLVEAFMDFNELPLGSSFRVGMQPRFFRPSRYTEAYPLPANAFWRSRDLGIQWKGLYEPVYAYVSLLNGVELDTRTLGEDSSARMIGEKTRGLDFNGNKEVGAGLGVNLDFDTWGTVDLLGFGVKGRLGQNDIDFLTQDVPGYGQSIDSTNEFAGFNLDYSLGEWDFFNQVIAGTDGEMDRLAWFTELSRKFEFKGLRYLNSIRPLVRYGEYNTNLLPRPFSTNGSLTWDRRQWAFALIAELVRDVNFRFEYLLNEENTGGPSADNDEFLFQLEIVF